MSEPRLPDPGAENAIYLLDVSSFVFRAYHALPPLSSSKGEPTHAVSGVNAMIQKLLADRKPKRLVVAMDQKGGSFRNRMYPEYKANRPPPPPDLSSQMEWVRKICEAWGFVILSKLDFEADDLIATAVKLARAEGLEVVIVSADKDLLQLVGDGVVMFDTMRNKVFGPDETLEKMGVPPNKVRDMLALVGDASDNVPGVPSVGPKTAAKLLEEFGTLDGIYEGLDRIKAKGTREKLAAHKAEAMLSRDLVSLREDVPLEVDLLEMRYDGSHPEELRAIYSELELVRALAQSEPRKKEVKERYRLAQTVDDVRNLAAGIREAGESGLHCIVDGDDPHRGILLGIALAWGEGLATYVPLVPTGLGQTLPDPDETIGILRPILSNSLLPKLVGDWKREVLALETAGIVARGAGVDVSLASYLLEPDRGDHSLVSVALLELERNLPSDDSVLGKGAKARRHVEATAEEMLEIACSRADFALRLGRELRPRLHVRDLEALYLDLELPLAEVLARVERTGIRVDVKLLERLSRETGTEIDALEKRCVELAGHAFNVGSPRQLETILFDELKLPVVKKTKTGRSTDHDVLEELGEQHELPRVILEHRSLAKLKGTYLDALPAQVDPRTGRIHTRFNQAVAATGRISSSDPNLQNIPIRTELGRRIRDAFVPDEGMSMLSADYSQIELRVLAHLSGDAELVDAYTRGDDVHRRTAAALFGVPTESVSREQRGIAKTVNFAVIYGQTEFALSRNLKIDRAEARRYIEAFFERYSGVQRFMSQVVDEARAKGYVTTLFGRKRTVADIHSQNPNLRNAAERVARNTPIQGTAADLLKKAMLGVDREIQKQRLRSRMLLTVHDELVFEVPPEERERVDALVRASMIGAAQLSVPLEVSVGWGPTWGAAH